MADEQGLRLVMSGDDSNYRNTLKGAQGATRAAATAISNDLNSVAGAAGAVVDAMGKLKASSLDAFLTAGKAAAKFQNTIQETSAVLQKNVDAAKALSSVSASFIQQAKSANLAGISISKYGGDFKKASNNVAFALTDVSRIAQDAPFGFIAIQNNIPPLIESFGRVFKSSGGVVAGLKGIGSALIGPAGIAVGISIVISVITGLIQKYGSIGNAIDALTNKMSLQQRLQKELNEELLKGAQDAQKEIIQTKRLFDVAKNATLSMQDRKKAIKELRDEYPAYLKNISDEQLLTGRAAGAYDKLKISLLEAAKARAIANKAAENAARDLVLEEKGLAVAQELAKVNQEIADRKALAAKLAGTPGSQAGGRDAILAIRQSQLEKQINDIFKERTAIIDQTLQLQQKLANTAAGIGKLGGEKDKDVQTVADVLKDMNKELDALNQRSKIVGISIDELAEQKLAILNKAFDEVAKIGGANAIKVLEELGKRISQVSAAILGVEKINTKQLFTFETKNILDKETGLSTERTVIRLPVSLKLSDLQPGIEKAQAQLVAGIQPLKSKAIKVGVDLSDALRSSISSAFSDFGDIIGNAISGSGLAGVLNGVVSLFSNFLKQMGQAMIASGTAMIAAKLLIKNPATAIAAGVAAIAISAALQNSIQKNVPSFATGGIVTKPTLAMIGDNPGKKEAVIPSELWPYLGGGGNTVVVGGEIAMRGEEAVLILKAGERSQNRYR